MEEKECGKWDVERDRHENEVIARVAPDLRWEPEWIADCILIRSTAFFDPGMVGKPQSHLYLLTL